MKRMMSLLALGLGIAAVACAGGSSSSGGGSDPASGDEQDVKSTTCGPALTLTCAPGFEITQVGCAQSHVAGAAPLGRCVSVDLDKLVGTFTSPAGKEDDLLFFTFAFSSDGTYKATGGCRPNPDGPSCFAITQASGTWTIQKSGPQLGSPAGASEIVLVDSFQQKTTLFYKIDGKNLSLSETFNGKQSEFVKQ
jgi:hypothetical protein